MHKLRRRLAEQEGFTLIELLVVIVIIGILMAIAVPSYLGFRDRANQKTADADVRAAIPSAEAYYSDCGTYANVAAGGCTDNASAHTFDVAGLTLYDSGLKVANVKSVASGAQYCIDQTIGGKSAHVTGPGGSIVEGSACP